jgi:hypothetical protein
MYIYPIHEIVHPQKKEDKKFICYKYLIDALIAQKYFHMIVSFL